MFLTQVCGHKVGDLADLIKRFLCYISHCPVRFEDDLETVMPDLFDCLLGPLEEFVDFLELEFLACLFCYWLGQTHRFLRYYLGPQDSKHLFVEESLSIIHKWYHLSLIHISEPTRRTPISYAVFCLKKK